MLRYKFGSVYKHMIPIKHCKEMARENMSCVFISCQLVKTFVVSLFLMIRMSSCMAAVFI